jgi:hypothetical protein
MTDSKNIATEKALEFLKPNLKRFYREWYKRWHERGIMSGDSNNKFEFEDNPELYAECQMILKSLAIMGFFKTWEHGLGYADVIPIRDKYRKRFVKHRLMPMVLKNRGIFPHMPKTLAISEFIARGFVHRDEVSMDHSKHWVKCTIAPLIWPHGYDTHQESIEVQGKMGIPGYTEASLTVK